MQMSLCHFYHATKIHFKLLLGKVQLFFVCNVYLLCCNIYSVCFDFLGGKEAKEDLSKFLEMVEETVDLDLASNHEYVIKSSFDEGLIGKCNSDFCLYLAGHFYLSSLYCIL